MVHKSHEGKKIGSGSVDIDVSGPGDPCKAATCKMALSCQAEVEMTPQPSRHRCEFPMWSAFCGYDEYECYVIALAT